LNGPEKTRTTKPFSTGFAADDAITATAGLKLVSGRDFNLKEFPTDSGAVLLNESAVKKMNLKNPIAEIVKDNGRDWHVVGVVKDFVLHSPFESTEPMVIEGAHGYFNIIHIKLNGTTDLGAEPEKDRSYF
jgi:hypothetical protein